MKYLFGLYCTVNYVVECVLFVRVVVSSKHSRRFDGLEALFLLVTVGFFLFLFDKFRLKHLLKHANKNKNREDCCSVPVICKAVVFRFF